MCTSSGDRKILMTVPGFCGSIRVTRPSAGDTTTSGSDGGTRLGWRKKYAIKSATTIKIADTYQNPTKNAAMANTSGTRMYGMLSLTKRNALYPTVDPALPRSVLLRPRSINLISRRGPLTSKGTRNSCSTSPSTFFARRNCRAVSVTQALTFLILQDF